MKIGGWRRHSSSLPPYAFDPISLLQQGWRTPASSVFVFPNISFLLQGQDLNLLRVLPDYCNPRDLFFASHSVHSLNHPTLSRDMLCAHCLNSFHAICPSTYFIPPYALKWDKDCSLVIFSFPMVPRGTHEFRFFFLKEDVDVRSSGLNYQHKIINCVRERWLKYMALGKHLQVTKETQTGRPPGGTSQRRGKY